MAKENSFDVVSEVDLQEVDNAFQQTLKEMKARYDLKGSGATLEFDKGNSRFTLNAPSEFVANQVIDVLNSKLIKRKIDLAAVKWSDPQSASGMTIRMFGGIIMGIDQDTCRKINKDIKAEKFKAKVVIEGDKLRVSSGSRDTLQEVIAFLRDKDYGQPLQFVNYR